MIWAFLLWAVAVGMAVREWVEGWRAERMTERESDQPREDSEMTEQATTGDAALVHKATPTDETLGLTPCTVCGWAVRPVPGGNGRTWVHDATGAVAARTPAVTPRTTPR